MISKLPEKNKLLMGVYELTTACNLSCSHCGTMCGKPRKDELSTLEAKNLINQCVEMGMIFLAFTGGEPLIHSDWFEIASHAKSKNLVLSFLTNGIAVDKNTIKLLEELKPVAVNISIDGIGITHDNFRNHLGAFEKSINALQLMKGKLPHCVVTTVTKDNFRQLSDLLKLMIDLDVWTWQIQIGIPMGRMNKNKLLTIEQMKDVVKFIVYARKNIRNIEIVAADSIGYYYPGLRDVDSQWNGCLAGRILASITSDGFITGCLSMPSQTREDNIRQRSLKEIWEDKMAFAYNRNFEPQKLTGECAECEFKNICRAGCWAVRFALNSETEYPFCFKS